MFALKARYHIIDGKLLLFIREGPRAWNDKLFGLFFQCVTDLQQDHQY